MLRGLLNSTSVPLLEQVVHFSELRQKLLAGNVANIDTPGYKPRDLPVDEFQQALEAAVARRNDRHTPPASALLPAAAPSESIEQHFPQELFQPEAAEARNITFQDGANRSIESLMMEMRKNAGRQRFAIEVITSQLNLLQTVISERA